jgi:hypothetical protein
MGYLPPIESTAETSFSQVIFVGGVAGVSLFAVSIPQCPKYLVPLQEKPIYGELPNCPE